MLTNVYMTMAILATLMFLDYFLSLKQIRLYEVKYHKYIEYQYLELNPFQRESVETGRYNFKHFLYVLFLLAIVYLVHFLGSNNIFKFTAKTFFIFQGILFSTFIYINSRHVQNIIIFNAVNQNPSMLSGKLKQKYIFSIKASSAHAVGTFLLLFTVFIFNPSYFTFGFALGPLLILYAHKKWVKVSKAKNT